MGRRLKLFLLFLGLGIISIHQGALYAQDLKRVATEIQSSSTPLIKSQNIKSESTKEIPFDIQVIPFSRTQAGKKYLSKNKTLPLVTDQYGFPPRRTVFYDLMLKYQQKSRLKQQRLERLQKESSSSLEPLHTWLVKDAYAMDNGPVPGQVNCRTDVSVTTGFFIAYFEDVALGNAHGYADPTFGLARRTAVCQVLQEIAALVNLSDAQVTPDILFTASLPPNTPSNALASASAYYGKIQSSSGLDNGTLHHHITSRMNPTPGIDEYDAVVNTNWNILSNTYRWSVDVPLISGGWNPNLTFDFVTVMRHEVFHALGFVGVMSDSVNTTGIEVFHNTFNENSYSANPTNSTNRYFTFPSNQTLSLKIQAPVGAPSSWFVNNASIYQGKINLLGAILSSPRALYSPQSWQQGSSLSHFDMNRAPTPLGTTYVMHPSIGPNTARNLHADELEVLCHLGYQVENLCDTPTPYASDDFLQINTASQCFSVLANDRSFTTSPPGLSSNLVIHQAEIISAPSGISISYFTLPNCTGSSSSIPSGALSIMVSGNNNLQPVNMKYQVRDTVSNRISQTAKINLSNCTTTADEYVCNGDFELGHTPSIFNAPYNSPGAQFNGFFYRGLIPFWSNYGSCDLVFKNSTYNSPNLNNLPYTYTDPNPDVNIDMIDSGSFAASCVATQNQYNISAPETLIARLKSELTPGQPYLISFDVHAENWGGPQLNNINISAGLGMSCFSTNEVTGLNFCGNDNPILTASDAFPIVNITIPIANSTSTNNSSISQAVYSHVSQIFQPSQAFKYLRIGPKVTQLSAINGTAYTVTYLDNISIKKVNLANSISGVVYNDTDQNGTWGAGEMELTNRTVGLYSNTSPPVLLQTATTSVTTPYHYTFPLDSNVQSSYLIALNPENVYQSVTEPTANTTTLITNLHHVKQVSFSGGHLTDQNFGVTLNGQIVPISGTITASSGCETMTGTILLTPSGGTPPYSYSWNGPNGFTSTNEDLSSLAPGGYSVTITDSLGSTGMVSVTVPNPSIISVTGTVTQATSTTGGSINASTTGGMGPYSYVWTNGQATSTISNLLPGAYSVNVTDQQGCTATQSFVINTPPTSVSGECCKLRENGNNNADCSSPLMNLGNPAGLSAALLRCNNWEYGKSCSWSFSNPSCCVPGYAGCSNTPGVACSPPSVSIPFPFTQLTTSSDPSAWAYYDYCKLQAMISNHAETYSCCVTMPALTSIKLQAKTDIGCTANSGIIDLAVYGGTAPYFYSWTGPNGFTATTQDLNGVPGGAYTVLVTDSTGMTSVPFSVTVPTFQPIVITGTAYPASGPAYQNGSINITVTPTANYYYTWTKAGVLFSHQEDLTGLAPGTYMVGVKNSKKCSLSKTFVVRKKTGIFNDPK